MAEDEEFPFEELPEEGEDGDESMGDVASTNVDSDSDYLSIPLAIQHLNSRVVGDGVVEMQVGARLVNASVVIDGVSVECSINLRLTGKPDTLPVLSLGGVVDVLV